MTSNATEIKTGYENYGTINYESDVDVFKFTPTENFYAVIETAGAVDTYGELLNSSGTVIAYDDDTGEGAAIKRNFKMVKKVLKGQTYYIKIREFNNKGTGNYTLLFKNRGERNSELESGLRAIGLNPDNVFTVDNDKYTYFDLINERTEMNRIRPYSNYRVAILRNIFNSLGAGTDINASFSKLGGNIIIYSDNYDLRMQAAQRAYINCMGFKKDPCGMDNYTWTNLGDTIKKFGKNNAPFNKDRFKNEFNKQVKLLRLAGIGLDSTNADVDNIINLMDEKRPIPDITGKYPKDIIYLQKILSGLGMTILDKSAPYDPWTENVTGFYYDKYCQTRSAIMVLHLVSNLETNSQVSQSDWDNFNQFLELYANWNSDDKNKQIEYNKAQQIKQIKKILADDFKVSISASLNSDKTLSIFANSELADRLELMQVALEQEL